MDLYDSISKIVLKKDFFSETKIADWQGIADEYPAFNIAQLLLAKKLRQQSEADYLQQAPITALRFSNIFWLNYLLADHTEELKTAPVDSTIIQEESINEESVKEDEVETDIVSNKLSAMLGSQAADFAKPVKENEQLAIETEPLFKIDYFASQGIIITKVLEQDGFGNKVKKFTDWLKDIKKTTSGAPQLNTTEEEEKQAAAQADASLKKEDVLTESMAEIWAQQGKKQQAVELYKKLSLIYPEKSAYFAAKIDSLH